MFSRLLVPLDGSPRAESALGAAVYFAKALGASVMLLHVIEENAPAERHSERHLRGEPEAASYLDKIKAKLEAAGLAGDAIGLHVHEEITGDVVRGIAEHAHELAADLIMMCTHGGADLRRVLWGAIAQQVAAVNTTPVFFVPPQRMADAVYSCGKIMLPLDGKEAHEAGIDAALFLAEKFNASILPVMVVPRQSEVAGKWSAVSRLLPSATQELLDLSAEQGAKYIDTMHNRFESRGVSSFPHLIRGEPKQELLKAVKRLDPDLVILGTHGRSGLGAFFEGSIAAQICSKAKAPLMLVSAERG
jgi:nucleotide-binding universal stress UspA family protein